MKKLAIALLATISIANAAPVVLQVESQIIQVNGKNVSFNTIAQPDGTWGYTGHQGEIFTVIVKNNLNESTVIHWHGITLPNTQDGVNGITQELPIPPHSEVEYKFPLNEHGTYWMHSHYGMQEQIGVEAPLIVLDKDDSKYQQIPVMFQDFSFKSPEEIFKSLHKDGSAQPSIQHDMSDMNASDTMDMSGMNMDSDAHMNHEMNGTSDLNDVEYDAFLTNYHSPDAPQITKVVAGSTVRLRFINGASASNFWINLGNLKGKLIAVDGQDVKTILGNKFPIAIGQRVDVLVTIPKTGGVFPIIGQVEGLKKQTGLVLSTTGAINLKIPAEAKKPAPAVGYQLETKLHPLYPSKLVAQNGEQKNLTLTLNGDMNSYNWTLNNQAWPNVTPIRVNQGDLVNLTFDNQSMMAHPMHLHGYEFKVVAIDDKPIDGTFRDTVMVMPHSKVTVQFVATQAGKWMLHCHVTYHMVGGMMTYLQVNHK